MLAAAPRWAVHQALAEREPADYCATAGRADAVQQLGVLPSMEDAAIAYRLLLEVRHSLQGFRCQVAYGQSGCVGSLQRRSLIPKGGVFYVACIAYNHDACIFPYMVLALLCMSCIRL